MILVVLGPGVEVGVGIGVVDELELQEVKNPRINKANIILRILIPLLLVSVDIPLLCFEAHHQLAC